MEKNEDSDPTLKKGGFGSDLGEKYGFGSDLGEKHGFGFDLGKHTDSAFNDFCPWARRHLMSLIQI